MRRLPLNKGRYSAQVDDDDYDRFCGSRWTYRPERDGNQGYAVRAVREGKTYRKEYLHRAVMQAPKGMEVIFLNHDRLDCRKENLKVVNPCENLGPQHPRKEGVSWRTG